MAQRNLRDISHLTDFPRSGPTLRARHARPPAGGHRHIKAGVLRKVRAD